MGYNSKIHLDSVLREGLESCKRGYACTHSINASSTFISLIKISCDLTFEEHSRRCPDDKLLKSIKRTKN